MSSPSEPSSTLATRSGETLEVPSPPLRTVIRMDGRVDSDPSACARFVGDCFAAPDA